jgi:tRNA dimethylallyltransferase
VEKGIIATRQLAKRQMTWLRSEDAAAQLECMDKSLFDKVMKLIRRAV